MPAFDAPRDRDDIIIIRDEKHWDPHESVRARTVVRAGDEEWVKNQQMLIQAKKGNRAQRRAGGFRNAEADVDIKNQLGAVNRLWVQRMLVDWTFTKDGMPMPITGESMKLLDQSYVDFIFDAINDAQPKDEDEDDDQDETEQGDEGSAFFDNVSHFTGGETNRIDLEQSTDPGSRNFLSKF